MATVFDKILDKTTGPKSYDWYRKKVAAMTTPGARAAFLRSLANTTTDKKFDKKTRYRINWRNNAFMRKTAKHYLFNHVRTSFLNITAEEMAIAIFLPVARFKKGSPY